MGKKNRKIKKELIKTKEVEETVIVDETINDETIFPEFSHSSYLDKHKWNNTDELNFIDNMGGIMVKKPTRDEIILHLTGYLKGADSKDWERCGLDKTLCVNRAKTRMLMYGVNYDLIGN